jgi:hypothetical protein
MKRKLTILLLLCGISGWIGYLWLSSTAHHSLPPEPVPPSSATEDNPFARVEFEWMRLRNPQTGVIPANIRAAELAFAATLPAREEQVQQPHFSRPGNFNIQNWVSRGPYNISGRSRAFGVDVADENILLCGAISGGMWRSADRGISWLKTTDPTRLHGISCLAQDTRPGKTNIWYYGTGEYRGNSASGGAAPYRGDGIFKSTNNGLSWDQLASTASNTPHIFDNIFDYVWNIAVDSSNVVEDEVYAAAYGSITRSTDGGQSWSTVLGGISNNSGYTDVAVTPGGVVYATLSSPGPTHGIFRSPDGVNWTDITPEGWPSSFRRIVLGFAPSNENVVYLLAQTAGVGVNDHSFWKYTYVSGNGTGSGGIWEDRSANLPNPGNTASGRYFQSYSSYCQVVDVHPNDENVVYIGGIDLYRSNDGFAGSSQITWVGGWQYENNYDHHADQHSLFFLPSNPNAMYSTHDGGLSYTGDNMSNNVIWTGLNEGFVTTQFYALAIDHSAPGNNIIVGGMQDNGTWFSNSSNATDPWVEVQGGDGAFCAIAENRSYYYLSYQNGYIMRRIVDDNGNASEWTRVDPAGGSGYLFINPFTLDPNNTGMMYVAGGSSLWRNSDLSAIPPFSGNPASINWTQFTNAAVASTITAVAAAQTPANRVCFGTNDGQVYRIENAHIGNPASLNISGANFPSGAYVSNISIDPGDGDKVIVVFSNYQVLSIFKTDDGGSTWTPVSGNLEENSNGSGNGPSVRWVAILPLSGGTTAYFAAASTGLYSTRELNGMSTNWVQEGASTIGNVVVDMVKTRQSDRLIAVATHGGGIYSSNILTGIAETSAVLPDQFVLSQNYPNPFNPVTQIPFSIPKVVNVNIEIFNLLGERVAVLVNEHKPGGFHTVEFDGSSLSGGMYLYRLRAGDFRQVRKMLLVK